LSISTNGGASFTNKTTADGLGNNTVWGVYAIGSTVYAATDNSGLSISTDGGASFTNKTTANGLGSNYVWGVYAVGSTVYAATQGGLSISTDGGATFTNKTTANGLGSKVSFGVFAIGSTVYVASNFGLNISTNGGASFTNYNSTNGLGDNYIVGVYASGNKVYAATDYGLSFCSTPYTSPTSGGTIATAQSGNNPFTPAEFTSSAAASGGTGTLEYKWQSSTTSNSSGFGDISSSNAATYTAGALTQTTWFKRLARVSCSADWTGAVESNVIEVTVISCTNPTSGGTIAAAQNGTTPFNPLAFTSSVAASGQSGTVEYKWQSSITNATTGFSDIASSNADTYDEGALTVTTWFKRLARVSCSADWTGAVESNVIEVTVVSLLPVTGIELGGTASDKQVKLSFKALNEREMSNYAIEHSTDGASFTNIGSLQASNANQATTSYSFADNQPIVGNNYYRIKGSSINGQIQFSNVVVVKYGVNVASVTVVPNPIQGKIVNLRLSQLAKGNYNISVTDAIGRSILKKEMLLEGSSSVQINLPTSVKAGNYFVKVYGQGKTFVQMFNVQ
jgi:hypothetical protein